MVNLSNSIVCASLRKLNVLRPLPPTSHSFALAITLPHKEQTFLLRQYVYTTYVGSKVKLCNMFTPHSHTHTHTDIPFKYSELFNLIAFVVSILLS